MKINKTILALVLLFAVFFGWYGYSWLPPRINLSSEERKNVTQFLQEAVTRCFGRYMIDLPETYTITHDNVMAFIDGMPIKYKRIYHPAFKQKIRLREAELSATKTLRPLDMPYLKGVYSLPDGMEGIIFERNNSTQVVDASRILEAHLYTNGVAIEITLEADNGLSSRYDEERKLTPEIYGNTVPKKLVELIDFLTRISGKQENEIPQEPGFCLPELFIKDGNAQPKEEVSANYTSLEYPAIKFHFDSDNYSASEDSLLERSTMMERNIKKAGGYTILSGRREINRLYAEQWLAQGQLSDTNGEQALRFVINFNEKTASPKHPMLSLTFLQQGLEGEGRLTEAEAVSIWQQITDTIRIRPNAIAK
ncbi:TPA: hypothetical protein JD264_25185 [Serratia fonticola]|nr:hypothetical protein [Serratia fonticola]